MKVEYKFMERMQDGKELFQLAIFDRNVPCKL